MTASSSPAPGQVSVWHAATAEAWADAGRRARAFEWLTPSDRLRYDRYRHDADRQMFLLGRAMARALVGRALDVPPLTWGWQEGRYGRPELSHPAAPLSFNLAHSAGVVTCALSRDSAVGVDIEHRGRATIDARLVRRFCSPSEIADIERRGSGWRDQFLKYWTLKEAYLKARGVGIAVHLSDVSFQLDGPDVRVEFLNSLEGTDTNWAFALHESGDSHFIAMAAPAPRGIRPTFVVDPMPLDLLP